MLRSPKSLNPRTVFKRSKLAELWKRRKISNFQYLMELNKMAGRTFNDIMQYPVFPWILSDYTSETIDLSDSRVYRDLTKPIGALNPNRLAQLLERYNEFADFGLPEQEKFLYGSHYSSPGVVLHFLIRQEPFTSMHIELQSGRFDCADRLFFDIAESWKSCLTSSSDMKELVCISVNLCANSVKHGHDVCVCVCINFRIFVFGVYHRSRNSLLYLKCFSTQTTSHWVVHKAAARSIMLLFHLGRKAHHTNLLGFIGWRSSPSLFHKI